MKRRGHLELLRVDPDTVDERVRRRERDCTALRLAALAQKRTTLIRLRDEHRIDDGVLRELQTQLDIEEVRLSRREAAE